MHVGGEVPAECGLGTTEGTADPGWWRLRELHRLDRFYACLNTSMVKCLFFEGQLRPPRQIQHQGRRRALDDHWSFSAHARLNSNTPAALGQHEFGKLLPSACFHKDCVFSQVTLSPAPATRSGKRMCPGPRE